VQGKLIFPFFCDKIKERQQYLMDKERVKLIVRNMELLVNALKKELEEPTDQTYKEVCSYIDEYEPNYYEEED
jgi:hypothetical protein